MFKVNVVCVDQEMGAAHQLHWSKYGFSQFFQLFNKIRKGKGGTGMLRHSLSREVIFFAAYYGFLFELNALFVCLSNSLLPACPPDVGGRQQGQ